MSGVSLCRFSRWRISAILDFKGFFEKPMYDYRSSIETIALNCLVFEKIAFFPFWRQDPRQTDEQMDSTDALSRSRCRERRLKNNEAEHSVLGHLVNVRSRSSYRSGLRSEWPNSVSENQKQRPGRTSVTPVNFALLRIPRASEAARRCCQTWDRPLSVCLFHLGNYLGNESIKSYVHKWQHWRDLTDLPMQYTNDARLAAGDGKKTMRRHCRICITCGHRSASSTSCAFWFTAPSLCGATLSVRAGTAQGHRLEWLWYRGFTVREYDLEALAENAQYDLFHNSCSTEHCLNHLYTANRKPAGSMQLRHRGHNFALPTIHLEFNKTFCRSYIVWLCLMCVTCLF